MATRGRKPTESEKAKMLASLKRSDRKFEFSATQKDPEAVLRIRNGAEIADISDTEFARQATLAAYDRVIHGQPIVGEIDWANINDDYSAPYLAEVPCGPWAEAISNSERFSTNLDVAEELEAGSEDVFIRASGHSMAGVGIHDGFLVLVRPYKKTAPRRGHAVLIQIFKGDGEEEVVGTLKVFDKIENGIPVLKNGRGEIYDLPPDAKRWEIIARVVGVIGRFEFVHLN